MCPNAHCSLQILSRQPGMVPIFGPYISQQGFSHKFRMASKVDLVPFRAVPPKKTES